MIELSNTYIREIIELQGWARPEDEKLHLFGIRSARIEGPRTIARIRPLPDQYDDTLVCFGVAFALFPCTVDPGIKYQWAPINRRGTAHLADGGPYRFRKGLHRGKPALVQSDAFKIWRDRNKNGKQDANEPAQWESGIGINLHRGGSAPRVGPWSAGCQVLPAQDFPRFWSVIEASGQREFAYWLIDGTRLET